MTSANASSLEDKTDACVEAWYKASSTLRSETIEKVVDFVIHSTPFHIRM